MTILKTIYLKQLIQNFGIEKVTNELDIYLDKYKYGNKKSPVQHIIRIQDDYEWVKNQEISF